MSDLKVEGQVLQDLARTIRRSAELMGSATSALSNVGAAGLGHRELDGAAEHFASEWQYGIGKLRQASDTVVQYLDEGLRAYQRTETTLADQIRPTTSNRR